MADFLKKDVQTPFRAGYSAAGVGLLIETNSESVLRAAHETLEPSRVDSEDVRLKLWVEEGTDPPEGTPRPYFRGLGHLVFSGYSSRSSLVINLRERCGAGRLTQALASTPGFWKTVFFPSVLGIVGPSVGLTSLHSACVAWDGKGLLLAGPGGSGKSSLSLALAEGGMDYLSDDRTLVSDKGGQLEAWGTSADMKQRPEAAAHFPELKTLGIAETLQGDPAFRFDPAKLFAINRIRSCRPTWIVFLERQSDPCFDLEEISPGEAVSRLEHDLHQQPPDAAKGQRLTVAALSRQACYVLRYAGNPRAIAGALRQVVVEREGTVAGHRAPLPIETARPTPPAHDPLRRFRATCLRSGVVLMGRHIRIETDSPSVLGRVTELFGRSEGKPTGLPHFLWRIVCESLEEPASWPPLTGFCDRGLRYVNLGQRSFLAADLAAREAVGVLPEALCEDRIGFPTVFLASLLHLVAPALGLTAVSAACVASGDSGLLLFGPANSGKTTVSYAASKLGLDFRADQATFLDFEDGMLGAWGDFWPAAFRTETARFLPELSAEGRAFTYRNRSFLCIDKGSVQAINGTRVVPRACVFLERQAASPPRLVPLSTEELAGQVLTEAGSKEDRETIVGLLGRLPAYRLLYQDDPAVAAWILRGILDADQLMEHRA